MADTVKITLARALKMKNRLAGQIAKLTQDVVAYNSVQQGSEAVDVRTLYAQRADLVDRLTDLKYAIYRTNSPVQKAIFELAEKKAAAVLLASLSTKHGTFNEGYPNAGEVTYVAQIRKVDVDEMVNRLEREIDRLQDQLDSFNHDTEVEIDRATADAARE